MAKGELIHGDCLVVLATLADNSVDSIVTDPPYGLSFMGKKWDYQVPSVEVWAECFRVLKPGGHALIACGTRTQHRMAVNIEDAGFEIKDVISWIFGSGFPKSLNVKKSAEKQGLGCQCSAEKVKFAHENMRDLQKNVDSADTLPDGSQSNLLTRMRRPINIEIQEGRIQESSACLQTLQKGISSKCRLHAGASKSTVVLQPTVQWQGEISGLGKVQQQRKGQKESVEGPTASEEPSVERRSDLQAQQGQLYRAEVSEVPDSIFSDGSEGRLHNGASASHGNVSESLPATSGGGPSFGSQHPKQPHIESAIIPRQPSTQTCGSCGKAVFDPGLGTALKPACEFWTLARKPLGESTVAKNVLKHGTGGINIDASRIPTNGDTSNKRTCTRVMGVGIPQSAGAIQEGFDYDPQGRFPANLLLSHSEHCDDDRCDMFCPIAMLDEQSGPLNYATKPNEDKGGDGSMFGLGGNHGNPNMSCYGKDKSGASRFFYCAKASKSERNAGLEGMPKVKSGMMEYDNYPIKTGSGNLRDTRNQNHHPTVKPIKLMEYLIRLITPPTGLVLDPFMGSGSTGVACKNLGFEFIGIEREADYVEIANKRIACGSRVK